jgi:hypothetical protein
MATTAEAPVHYELFSLFGFGLTELQSDLSAMVAGRYYMRKYRDSCILLCSV